MKVHQIVTLILNISFILSSMQNKICKNYSPAFKLCKYWHLAFSLEFIISHFLLEWNFKSQEMVAFMPVIRYLYPFIPNKLWKKHRYTYNSETSLQLLNFILFSSKLATTTIDSSRIAHKLSMPQLQALNKQTCWL